MASVCDKTAVELVGLLKRDDGVDGRIHRRDPRKAAVQQLDGRQRPARPSSLAITESISARSATSRAIGPSPPLSSAPGFRAWD